MKLFLFTLSLLMMSWATGQQVLGSSPHSAAASSFAASDFHHDVEQRTTVPSANDAPFAQLESSKGAPISIRLVLTLVAGFVIALRLIGLNHARAMADHERSSYQGKARMFHSLHEERSQRD